MDRFLDALSSYAVSLTFEKLPAEVIHETKRRIIDVLGCAMGAYTAKPAEMARAHAREVIGDPGSTVLGSLHRSSPELASFANGVMARYLDFNDCSQALEPGHPSDNIPAMLAAAEYAGGGGKSAMNAIVLAYEMQGCLGEVASLKNKGWDHVGYVAISSAVGAGRILGLSKEAMANAIALAATPNNPLRQTRVGALSMWKGCAAANACRNGIFAALMAARGLTGPSQAFEGPKGYLQQVTGPMAVPQFGGNGKLFRIQQSKLKYYPSDYEAQCMVNAALEIKKQLKSTDAIASVKIGTYAFAIDVAADTRDKWTPTSRETADHSLPYVLAVILTDGYLWLDHFTDERIRDPKLHALMQKIEVYEDPECTADYPDANRFKIELTTKLGVRYFAEMRYGKGHPKNPMSDSEIETKFRRLAEPVLIPRQIDNILDRLWRLDEVVDLQELLGGFLVQPRH